MTKLPPSLVAIVALSGCTATFLICTDASAFTRAASRPSFAPRFAAARTNVPSFRPRMAAHQTATFARPVFRPVSGQTFAHIPLQSGIVHRFPQPTGLVGHLPRPSGLAGNFPHPGTIGGFPHSGTIGSGFPRQNNLAGNFPHPGTIGGFPHSGSPSGTFPHPGSLGTPAGTATAKHNLGHGFSIGDIPVIGPAVGAASKTVGDVVTGKIQNVPGDIISGPGKVVTGTIGQLTPKPASTSEPQGSTTSDASGFNTGKPSIVQTALLLKQINDMKAAAAAGSNQGKPSIVQTALLLKRINDMKAAQQASAATTPTPPIVATNTTTSSNTTTTSNTTTSKQPGQVFCIVAPCPVIHPGSPPPVSGKNPGGALNPPVTINVGVGSVGGNGFPGQGITGPSAGAVGAPLPVSPTATQPIVASASSYQAIAYQPQTSTAGLNLPAPGSLGTPVATQTQTPDVTGATPTDTAASNPMFVFVAFQKDVSAADLATFLKVYKVSIVDGPNADGLYKLQLAEPLAPDVLSQMIDSMKSQTAVVASVAS